MKVFFFTFILLNILQSILCYSGNVPKEVLSKSEADENGCDCSGHNCSCCANIHIPEVKLNSNICLVLEYMPEDLGVSVEVTFDGHVIIKETVSLRNPPPICFGIPKLEKYASVCFEFYNVTWKDKVGACVRFEAELWKVVIKKINIGCFSFLLSENDRILLQKYLQREHHARQVSKKKVRQIDASDTSNDRIIL